MLTSREAASLIVFGATALVFLLFPSLRKNVSPDVKNLIKAVVAPRMLVAYLLVVAVSAASTALEWLIGVWNLGLIKDAIILTLTVVLPMTFRSFSFKSGGDLSRTLIRETLGLTALLSFYLDSTPLPLAGELIFQTVASFVALGQSATSAKESYSVKRACDLILIMMGLFFLIWTTLTMVSSPPDWSSFFRSLLFNFWLPLSLLPFFYIFGFYALTEDVRTRFMALGHPFTPQLMLAFLIGTRLRLSLLAQFGGRYNCISKSHDFRDGLRQMHKFREDIKYRNREEAERLEALEKYAENPGIDSEGAHLDRRDFGVTKNHLNRIWNCQNGQYERRGGRYWDHLTDQEDYAERNGLPADHGFVVEVTNDGKIWRAWRKTPGGTVLGIGGAEHRSKYYYQGETQPQGWPENSPEWVNDVIETLPPDWSMDDSSRL